MAPGFTIRPMAAEDVPALAEIERACFSTPWSEASLAAELQKPGAVFLVAELDGETAGYAGMNWVLDEGYMDNVAVLPAFRRQGVARALMEALAARARELGLSFLTLEVRLSNTEAAALYRGLGFREAGRRRNFYARPTEDALILTKEMTD